MNPVVVIPTYWAQTEGMPDAYDHATPLTKPQPELERCLSSLEGVRGIIRVVVLVAAVAGCEDSARARVNAICAHHPNLNPLVVGTAEANLIRGAVSNFAPGMTGETISLRGYGAIRNMGLAVAAVLGHDVVVFLDDDEIVTDPDFLVDAIFGLGRLTRDNMPVWCKTGYFYDHNGSPLADESRTHWYDHWWAKRREFNSWMRGALEGPRISRSNYACGGCMAIHAQAFTSVAFDPWITRGEDLDYLINLRMRGIDMWFDNKWHVDHRPPATPNAAARFLQDVFRWTYEVNKLDMSARRIDLGRVKASSLMPYPGQWLSESVFGRISHTALARAIGCPEHSAYLSIFLTGRNDARRYAQETAESYLAFQTYWPTLMGALWKDELMAKHLLATGTPHPTGGGVDWSHEAGIPQIGEAKA